MRCYGHNEYHSAAPEDEIEGDYVGAAVGAVGVDVDVGVVDVAGDDGDRYSSSHFHDAADVDDGAGGKNANRRGRLDN